MKKNILVLLLACVLTLGACGQTAEDTSSSAAPASESSEEEQESTEEAEATEDPQEVALEDEYVDEDATPIVDKTIEEEGIDAFISLGDYKGLELTKTITTVTDEDVENRIASELDAYPVPVEDETAILMPGLIANIDFAGDIDGEPFDGGTGEDYDLMIGSGDFIEGFEDQLVEHKKGDVVDVNVTFPEDYYEELAGKAAHFSVTINSIKERLAEPTDEWCAENTDYATVKEYRDGIRETMQKEYDEDSEYTMSSEAWDMISQTAVYYQYPKNMIDDYTAIVKANFEYYAGTYGMTIEELMESYNMKEENFVSEAKPDVQQSLIAAYILTKENIPLEGKEIDDAVLKLLHESGMDSIEDAAEYGISEKQLHYVAMRYLAEDKLLEYAKVTEVEAEDDAADEEAVFDDGEINEEEIGEIVGYSENGEPIEKVEGDAN